MKLTDLVNEITTEASIKSIVPSKIEDIPDSDKQKSYEKLSDTEKKQLEEPGYVPYQLWPVFRKFLLERSLASNSSLSPELTAYTPGETVYLLNNAVIKSWHNKMMGYKVEGNYKKVVFVPCAKTKPWENATRGIYKDYNKLRGEHPELFFVTISEPLGIVPQTLWGSFPQYDNPGLFKDSVQRSGGMFTSDFKRLFNSPKQLKVPFDLSAYNQCIDILAGVIKSFINSNTGKEFISFVEDFEGVGTHSDMLTRAGFTGKRLYKREEPRTGPYSYIKKNI
jgi:hypothetical protein